MLREEQIEEAAHRFALLGDPTRLRLLVTLMNRGELSVGELAAAAGTSRFNASGHLMRLARAGLVVRRPAGTVHYYSVGDGGLAEVCRWVCQAIERQARSLTG